MKLYLKWLVITIFIMIAFALLFFFNPASSNLYPPCPFYKLTDFYCPGCGSLRSLHQLMHGHPLEALDLNPLMVLFLPFLGYIFISQYWQGVHKQSRSSFFISPRIVWILLGIILVFWIFRNIPFYPFSWLAP